MVNSLLNTAQQLKGMIEHAKLQADASKDAAIAQVKLQAEAEKKEVSTTGFLLNILYGLARHDYPVQCCSTGKASDWCSYDKRFNSAEFFHCPTLVTNECNILQNALYVHCNINNIHTVLFPIKNI